MTNNTEKYDINNHHSRFSNNITSDLGGYYIFYISNRPGRHVNTILFQLNSNCQLHIYRLRQWNSVVTTTKTIVCDINYNTSENILTLYQFFMDKHILCTHSVTRDDIQLCIIFQYASRHIQMHLHAYQDGRRDFLTVLDTIDHENMHWVNCSGWK